MLVLLLAMHSQCDCYLSLQWLYQISAACHTLRHFYRLFSMTIYGKCKLAQYIGFLYAKAGGSTTMPMFFFSLSPSDVLFIFFFHQDAYKCSPFIIFLNINAPVTIIRKPTLSLCSFHNNDNKCFVGYF